MLTDFVTLSDVIICKPSHLSCPTLPPIGASWCINPRTIIEIV